MHLSGGVCGRVLFYPSCGCVLPRPSWGVYCSTPPVGVYGPAPPVLQTGYSRLVSLNLHGCAVTDESLAALHPSLTGHFPALQELTLSCNHLTAGTIPALTRWVGKEVWHWPVCMCVNCAMVHAGLCQR